MWLLRSNFGWDISRKIHGPLMLSLPRTLPSKRKTKVIAPNQIKEYCISISVRIQNQKCEEIRFQSDCGKICGIFFLGLMH